MYGRYHERIAGIPPVGESRSETAERGLRFWCSAMWDIKVIISSQSSLLSYMVEQLVLGLAFGVDHYFSPSPLVLPDGVAFNTNTARDPWVVIMLDDFVQQTNAGRFEFHVFHLPRVAGDRIDGVYYLVTTQNTHVANALVDESAWVKLNPLRGTYTYLRCRTFAASGPRRYRTLCTSIQLGMLHG